MNDINGYNERMRATMEDKMWFVKHLPANIDTVIDFGCADGSLFRALNHKYPGRFKLFVGIEESDDMRHLANINADNRTLEVPILFAASFEDIKKYKQIKPENCVFVMSSVIHEIFNYKNDALISDDYSGSYSHCKYLNDLIESVNDFGIKCIAIRDMFARLEKYYNALDKIHILRESKAGQIFQQYEDYFNKHWAHLASGFMYVGNYIAFDFLMKWFYSDNWDREMKEFYFWNWLDGFLQDNTYPIKHLEYFNIPYVVDKAKELGIDMNWNTHAKLLLMKK